MNGNEKVYTSVSFSTGTPNPATVISNVELIGIGGQQFVKFTNKLGDSWMKPVNPYSTF